LAHTGNGIDGFAQQQRGVGRFVLFFCAGQPLFDAALDLGVGQDVRHEPEVANEADLAACQRKLDEGARLGVGRRTIHENCFVSVDEAPGHLLGFRVLSRIMIGVEDFRWFDTEPASAAGGDTPECA
jgi:hypothetical protein